MVQRLVLLYILDIWFRNSVRWLRRISGLRFPVVYLRACTQILGNYVETYNSFLHIVLNSLLTNCHTFFGTFFSPSFVPFIRRYMTLLQYPLCAGRRIACCHVALSFRASFPLMLTVILQFMLSPRKKWRYLTSCWLPVSICDALLQSVSSQSKASVLFPRGKPWQDIEVGSVGMIRSYVFLEEYNPCRQSFEFSTLCVFRLWSCRLFMATKVSEERTASIFKVLFETMFAV